MPSPLLYPIAAMAGGVSVYWWMSKRGSQPLDAAADRVTLAATAGEATLSLPAHRSRTTQQHAGEMAEPRRGGV